MKMYAFLLLFLCSITIQAQDEVKQKKFKQYNVKDVPNVKLITNSYVSNPDTILASSTVSQLDQMLSGLEQNATAQVAVVVLGSIGETPIEEFADSLFNYWGIGQEQNSNGLLLLFAEKQRQVRFETGEGLEAVLPDAVCFRIQQNFMVPYFRQGNYDSGFVSAISEVAKIVSDPKYAEEVRATVLGRSDSEASSDTNDSADSDYSGFAFFIGGAWLLITLIVFIVKLSSKSFKKPDTAKIHIGAFRWLVIYMLLPVGVIYLLGYTDYFLVFFGGIYAYVSLLGVDRKQRAEAVALQLKQQGNFDGLYKLHEKETSFFGDMAIVFPLPNLFFRNAERKQLKAVRELPRNCKNCGKPLRKLDDKAEDKFLREGQIKEEEVGSVDYDVWHCEGCGEIEQFIFENKATAYTACPSCSNKTERSTGSRTLKRATEYSEGLSEVSYLCVYCNKKRKQQVTLPRITPPPPPSSSSSSSRSSYSSGSSSSSGGSWGGGRSSGGGSTSSW